VISLLEVEQRGNWDSFSAARYEANTKRLKGILRVGQDAILYAIWHIL
jgi:hypothetical protein